MAFIYNLDPVFLSIGSVEIRWYGLFYALGFIITYFMMIWLAKKKKINLKAEDVSDLLLYVIIGVVLGARIFYVVFYNIESFMANPLSIFAVWQGGLSFHGGLVGGVIAVAHFCRVRKISFYTVMDIAVLPVALGLALGRLGNFMNAELVGRVTSVSWGVVFPGYDEARHPSQLYASAKNLINFAILWYFSQKSLPPGALTWIFALNYSVLRFCVEFFREPDAQLGFVVGMLSMGQVLSIVLFVVSIVFLRKVYSKP